MKFDETQTTPEGTVYKIGAGCVVIPTPDHPTGGGVALSTDWCDAILADVDGGTHRQLDRWTDTGETVDTRAGESRVLELEQDAFSQTRTVRLSVVDVADIDMALREGDGR